MDVKEKLVALKKVLRECLHFNYDEFSGDMSPDVDLTAENLIAHGVTMQQWVPVKDRLPEENERVLVWIGNNRYNDVRKDTDRVHNGKWVRWGGCVTHWAPWNMPQPPKGE